MLENTPLTNSTREFKSNLLIKGLVYKNEIINFFVEEHNHKLDNNSDLTFINCVFEEPVIFNSIFAREVTFYKCTFKKEVFINNCTFSSLTINETIFNNSFDLIRNDIRGYTVIKKTESNVGNITGKYGVLQFTKIQLEKLNIGDINIDTLDRSSKIEFLLDNKIGNLEIKPHLTYSHISFLKSNFKTIFLEGNFKNQIIFKGEVKCKSLFFESSSFDYRIDFQKGDFEYVHFYRNKFNGLVFINDFEKDSENFSSPLKIKSLSIHSNIFSKSLNVWMIFIENISLSNNYFNQEFHFNNYAEVSNVNKTKTVMLSLDGVNRGTIFIERCYLDIVLGGINFGDIFLKDLNVWSILLMEFDNKGSLTFNNINSCSYFTINNSVSGKLNFINSDINQYSETVIANSNIIGFNSPIYPNNIRSYSKNPKVGYGISDKSLNRENLKSIYNQFKQIAKANGDSFYINKFKSLEHKNLLLSKRFGTDSLLLFLNWVSNNNGKSWFRGVIFTFTIAFVFFYIYTFFLVNSIDLNLKSFWTDYILFISSFPKLSLEKHSEYNSIWYISFIIWVSRIFISYGIYQTIAAFRKFGKN